MPHVGKTSVVHHIGDEGGFFVELPPGGEKVLIKDEEAQPKQVVAFR